MLRRVVARSSKNLCANMTGLGPGDHAGSSRALLLSFAKLLRALWTGTRLVFFFFIREKTYIFVVDLGRAGYKIVFTAPGIRSGFAYCTSATPMIDTHNFATTCFACRHFKETVQRDPINIFIIACLLIAG